MTLVITELSEFGIAMVADSAVTIFSTPPTVKTGFKKLHAIPYLKAGISMWGLGSIGNMRTDIWVERFIKEHSATTSLDEFARQLADSLQQAVGVIQKPMGFHLAGYVEQDGTQLPTLYHIRNVDGNYLHYEFHNFVVGQDNPPQDIASNAYPGLRNGDYGPYAILSEAIKAALDVIINQVLPATDKSLVGIQIPRRTLEGRVMYLKAQLEFVSGLYASSALLPTIGGNILSLGITPDGITTYT